MMIGAQSQGMGDWFEAACEPGTPGCVPHWYCYIPAMATPDCWASFVQGARASGQVVGRAVTEPIAAAVGGVFTGAVGGVTGGDEDGGGSPKPTLASTLTTAMMVGGLVIIAIVMSRR